MEYYEIIIKTLDGEKQITRRHSDIFFEDDSEHSIGVDIKDMYNRLNK